MRSIVLPGGFLGCYITPISTLHVEGPSVQTYMVLVLRQGALQAALNLHAPGLQETKNTSEIVPSTCAGISPPGLFPLSSLAAVLFAFLCLSHAAHIQRAVLS